MRLGVMVLFALWGIGSAQACEDYVAIDSEQTKELMATLGDPDTSSVDRLFAFQTLKCSDMPVLRDYAMREGLKNSKDNTVRAQIMMDALMAKPVLKIALIATPAVGPKGRDFIKRNEGAIYLGNQFSDPRQGCISFAAAKCVQGHSMHFKGTTVTFVSRGIIGEFQLGDENTLMGTVRADQRSEPVPARLFIFDEE